MRSTTYALAMATTLALAACGGGDGSPATPSTYGNPRIETGAPVVIDKSSVLLSVSPAPGTALRPGDTIEERIVFHFPRENFPTYIILYLVRGDGSDGMGFYYGDGTYLKPGDDIHVVGTLTDFPYHVEEHLVAFAGEQQLNLLFVLGTPNSRRHEDQADWVEPYLFRFKPEGIAYKQLFPLGWTVRR